MAKQPPVRLNVHGIAIVVGVGMVVGGVARMLAGWRGEVDERYSFVVGGLAGVVFGIFALAWPDITVLVIGLLVGPVAVVFGAGQVVRALRRAGSEQPVSSSRARVWLRSVGTTVALLLALVLVLVSALVHQGSPGVSSFYTWSGSQLDKPGVLLREQGTIQGMPAGSHAVRILYTTTGVRPALEVVV